MIKRSARGRPSFAVCNATQWLLPLLACTLAATLQCAPANALKMRLGGANEECVSERISAPRSYVTGSFVSLEGSSLQNIIGGRASYNLRVRGFQHSDIDDCIQAFTPLSGQPHRPNSRAVGTAQALLLCTGCEPTGPRHSHGCRSDRGQIQLQGAVCGSVPLLPLAGGAPRYVFDTARDQARVVDMLRSGMQVHVVRLVAAVWMLAGR